MWRRRPAVALTAIVATAALFRVFRLMSLFPILIDESIYMRWAEIIDHQGQWFISLLDAKQPFSYWIYALIRQAAPDSDPLFGPRLVSACAGIGSVLLLFRLGRRLAGARAGLLAALFYAALPFGVLYDRLGYTDALVNLSGIAITVVSVEYFSRTALSLRGTLLLGALLGIGFSIKSTFTLFIAVPVLAYLLFQPERRLLGVIRLCQMYAVFLVLPIVSWLCVPNAPQFEVNNLLFHHTSFFPPLDFLIAHPLLVFMQNLQLASEYARCYITVPLTIAGMAAAGWLILRRTREGVFLALLLIPPLLFELTFLWMVHSRYLFPLVWPIPLAAAIAVAEQKRQWVAPVLAVALCVPLLFASGRILINPRAQLHSIEIDEFLSSGPYSGYGIQNAVDYLRRRTSEGPITVLTDPLFGTPADAIHAYLNLWHGTHVYDAWWLQEPGQPICPRQPMEVMKSQYQRVPAGVVDFPTLSRVYYVTDTNYNKWPDVRKREPDANLVARFIKANGVDSIDVYRVK